MKKLLLFLYCFLVWPVFAQNAMPFCTSMTTRVHVRTHIGNPKYVTRYSKQEFLKKEGRPADPYTLGLTVAELAMNTKTTPSIEKRGAQICVGLSDLEVELDYPNLTVYIDKKYAPSSCEFKIIKDHENYHVMVVQQSLPFFRKDIEDALYKALKDLSPKIVKTNKDIQPTLEKLTDSLVQSMQPVLKHINAKLLEKNAAIDTPEMYRATTKMCKNW